MPTTYTHFQFGQDCLRVLPPTIFRLQDQRKSLYHFGLQGPDLLFYGLPWRSAIRRHLGNEIHQEPARKLFARIHEACLTYPRRSDELMVYAFGLLAHFILDTYCHPYIERKEAVSGLSHNYIESQYDGHMMRQNGVGRPEAYPRSYLIEPNQADAEVIAAVYGVSSKEIFQCMNSQAQFLSLLSREGAGSRKLIRAFLRAVSSKGAYQDLMVEGQEDPACRDSNLRLDKLRAMAQQAFARLAPDLEAYLRQAKPLPALFDRDFGPGPDIRSIPVLSAEEEEAYDPEEGSMTWLKK